jgi:hypothetical protein
MNFAVHLHAVSTQNAKFSTVNLHVRVFQLTLDPHLLAADMNANLTMNVDHKNIAINGNVSKLAHSAERAQLATTSSTIAQFVNAQRTTSDHRLQNVDQNATAMLIVPDRNQLVSMEFVRIHVTVLAVLTLTVTFVD